MVLQRKAAFETLVPKERNVASYVITRADGTVEEPVYGWNARVNSGAQQQAVIMGSAAGTAFNYLALSTNSLTIAMGDTTLSGEITSGSNAGLARTQASYGTYVAPTALGGSASFQLTHTFTATNAATVQSCALFDASSAGHMFSEINFSASATLNAGDSLAVTYTLNI
jgi:hypothetical protein